MAPESYDTKKDPSLCYIRTGRTRVTTLIYKRLAPLTSSSTVSIRDLYSSTITCAYLPAGKYWFRHSLLGICIPLGVKLKDVFITGFPRASHHPAAFCVLLPITTFSYHRFSS